VLFAPRAFATLLALFASSFSGRSAEERRTPLAGRLGQKLGPAGLLIVDDATLPGGPASRPFDVEGVPSRRTTLVEGGAFCTFLHTSDTARRAGAEPTGHAQRGYQWLPTVAPSNLSVPAGKDPPEALRAGAAVEVLEVTGNAGASPVSGELSLPVQGFRLKGGQRAEPLHDFTVAGDFLGLLASFRAAGSDFEFGLRAWARPSGAARCWWPGCRSREEGEHMSARIIAINEPEGRVGKTTTAINLGAALAELGRKVLLVDLDPQANLTRGLGVSHEEVSAGKSTYEVMTDHGVAMTQALRKTRWERLDLVPSHIDLSAPRSRWSR